MLTGVNLTITKLAGIQVFVLLFRFSMFKAWWDYLRSNFGSKREFVSLDAKQNAADSRDYELNKYSQSALRYPQSAITSPYEEYDPHRRSSTGTPDYFGKEVQRDYKSPTLSFSTPRAPSQATMRGDWDPRATHARGGLGLHPIDDEEDGGMTNKI